MSEDLSTAPSPPSPTAVLAAAGRAVEEAGRAVLCQIVRTEGSTPGKVGWKLLVRPDGPAFGNLGGGAFEALVEVDAVAKLAAPAGAPDGASEVKRYYLTEQAVRGEPTGMVCGGLSEVFLEVMTAPPVLVVCGGGPVGQAVARAGDLAGFDLLVVEDREEFRQPERFPAATRFVDAGRDFRGVAFLCGEGAGPVGSGLAGRDLYVAVVTRCWETDTDALAAILDQLPAQLSPSPPETAGDGPRVAYLGLMGSRRKVARVRRELATRGFDLAALPPRLELHAPIGLPLGGDSPGEIAISILAEVLQSRHGTRKDAATDPVVERAGSPEAEAEASDPGDPNPESPAPPLAAVPTLR